ncbi:MAG: two-component system response regulator RegA [Paraglaciecola psychrophila]
MIKEQLLVVDDDEVVRRVLARAFSRRGFEVAVAGSIDEALMLAAQCPFNRAVVDLKLNQESGLRLISALKEAYPAMAVVMLTGYSSIATAVEAIKLGAVNYLCKPADADEILQAFEAHSGAVEAVANPPSVNRLQWEHIQKVLAEHDGNVSATARALNMHRRTLQRRLQKKPVMR